MTSILTGPQFVCEALGIPRADPPADRSGRVAFGEHPDCYLCGGPTGGRGWLREAAIAPTFTQTNQVACGNSDTVCWQCVALSKGEVFQSAVARFAPGVKTWTQCGWHSYSHAVWDGHYEAPGPYRIRELLLDPPSAPWVLGINPSGRKHTIFKARPIPPSATVFQTPIEETVTTIDVAMLRSLISDFESLTAAGARKDEVSSGRYHPEFIRRLGPARWRALEEPMIRWRRTEPELLALAEFCAFPPSHFKEDEDK